MCGIFLIFSNQSVDLQQIFTKFQRNISRRGPDLLQIKTHEILNYNLLFASSVLWLQGSEMTKQPFENGQSIFVYNGDIYDLPPKKGDTSLFLEKLENDCNLELNQGPYAFIRLNKCSNKIYFGRDRFGRRSLLIGRRNDCFIITSVAIRKTGFNFIEVPSIGTFCYDLTKSTFSLLPWSEKNRNFSQKVQEFERFLDRKIEVFDVTRRKSLAFVEPKPNDLNHFNTEDIFKNLLKKQFYLEKIVKLQQLLENSTRKRVKTQPDYCKNCIKNRDDCNHCLTGVLFSGGIDCAILALLADKFTDKNRPIDLINVAFSKTDNYDTPDRLTALSTLEELQKLANWRHWNLIQVNISEKELNTERTEQIADLIYPLNTILDDSLGCALWFAAKGHNSSRVLIAGMGADELFGGYSRHRAALKKSNWLGLHQTLEEDWQNLPHRNLARDDRVISDHGCQLRTPYLDEEFVNFVQSLQCWIKTCPSDSLNGIGEKIMLRTLGYFLGFEKAAGFKKRALQFGTRIANPKEKAHEVSKRLNF